MQKKKGLRIHWQKISTASMKIVQTAYACFSNYAPRFSTLSDSQNQNLRVFCRYFVVVVVDNEHKQCLQYRDQFLLFWP